MNSTALRDTFSDDEWFLLGSTPSLIGAAMSAAAPSGFFGTIKEVSASMKAVIRAKSTYPDNALIQELLSRADNWDDAREHMKDYRERIKARVESANLDSPESLEAMVLGDVRRAMALVEERCSAEQVADYKAWSVDIARAVAEAAKEGSVLGMGGVRVSSSEQRFLASIEDALGLQSGQLLA